MYKGLAVLFVIPLLFKQISKFNDFLEEFRYYKQIIYVLEHKDEKLLAELLSENRPVENELYHKGRRVYTLQRALVWCNFDIFKMLVDAGYDVNVCTDTIDPTLLFYTSDFQKTKLLLEKGIDSTRKNQYHRTALEDHLFYGHLAQSPQAYSLAKLLLMATYKTPDEVREELWHLSCWKKPCLVKCKFGKKLLKFLKGFNKQCILERKLFVKHENFDCEFIFR